MPGKKYGSQGVSLWFYWIIFGFPILIVGFQNSIILWIAVAWWGIPLIFVYFIPTYKKHRRRKKEAERMRNETELREKRKHDVDILFRMFKRHQWVTRLDSKKVRAELTNKISIVDYQGEPYLHILMSSLGENKEVNVISYEDLKCEARSFREGILHEREVEKKKNAEADRLAREKSLPPENDLKQSNHGVFICYSHRDSSFVDHLVGDLKKAQIDIWIDESEIKVGDSLPDKISEGIKRNDYLITVLSKASVRSNWVKKELNAALMKEMKKRSVVVLPVLLEKCEIPALIAEKMYADFTKGYDSGLKVLLDRFRK